MQNELKKIYCFLSFLFINTLISAQSITGTWKGRLQWQSREIPIVFHIGKDSSGELSATFDSPSQNAHNLPISKVITKSDSVIFKISILNGKYAGILDGIQKRIEGRWFQGGGSLPLVITQTSDSSIVKKLSRPQTPKPPFPYQTRDVEYWSADKKIQYGATLTYPSISPGNPVKKSFPSIILISGSGQQDRDEMFLDHKPFAVIADHLTRKGFLVLRVDDRGIGKTTGDFSKSNTLDFVKDVEAGLDFLKTLPEVNKNKMGLIGHSEGGMIAPIVADERKEVKFIILLAGPGIPSSDLMQEQEEATAISMGNAPNEAKAKTSFARVVWEEEIKNLDQATTFRNIKERLRAWVKNLDTTTLVRIRKEYGNDLDNQIKTSMEIEGTPWFKFFIQFDPGPYLQKLNCKVLALNGSRDVQVMAHSNLEGIRNALGKSPSPKYDLVELPGLNHLFQTCKACNPSEYYNLDETFSPIALNAMDQWLLKNVL